MEKKFYLFLKLSLFCIFILAWQGHVASQNKYVVRLIQPEPVLSPEISEVTVTPENKNLIEWEVQTNDKIQSYNIYRDDIATPCNWEFAGKTNYPDHSFVDRTSFPQLRSYQYRISAVDQCSNELFSSIIHKTIKLSVKEISTDCFALNWNSYKGFQVTGYNIYSGETLETMELMETISNSDTTFTDCVNTAKSIFYMVEAIGIDKTPPTTKSASLHNNKTRSNIVFGRTILSSSDSLEALNVQVYPNPMAFNALVTFPYDPSQKYQLSIIDLFGHTVLSKPVNAGEIEIRRENLKDGLYFLQIAGRKIYKKKLKVGSI